MKLAYANGVTSVILRVKILDSASTTGAAKTGLTHSSSGLIVSTIADNEATATAYTQAASNIESITTLGTFATPTSGKCRFKEVDATNHPGLYEIQIANARWAVTDARSVIVTVSGVSGTVQVDAEIQLSGLPADIRRVMGGLPAHSVEGSYYYLGVDIKSVDATPNVARALYRLFNGYLVGAVDSATFTPTTTAFEVTTLADTADNTYANQSITFTTGPLMGKTYFITASEGTVTNANDKVKLTIQAAHAAPGNGNLFIVGPGTRGS